MRDKDKVASYAEYMSVHTLHRNQRSCMKSWEREVFGKDWFYRLVLAFGTIDTSMVNIINDIAYSRAKYSEEQFKASSQGGPPDDSMRNKSERTNAELNNTRIPEVKGPSHKRSVAFNARVAAREMEIEFKNQTKYWRIMISRGQLTWQEVSPMHVEFAGRVFDAWEHAEELSVKSGFPFYDKHGIYRTGTNYNKPEPFMLEVVNSYLATTKDNWKRISG